MDFFGDGVHPEVLELGGGGVLVRVDAMLAAEGVPGLDSVVGQPVGVSKWDVEKFGDSGTHARHAAADATSGRQPL